MWRVIPKTHGGPSSWGTRRGPSGTSGIIGQRRVRESSLKPAGEPLPRAAVVPFPGGRPGPLSGRSRPGRRRLESSQWVSHLLGAKRRRRSVQYVGAGRASARPPVPSRRRPRGPPLSPRLEQVERTAPKAVSDILTLLETGDDEGLLGVYETAWLDFKGSPYRLNDPREQWEMAKDVAGLAEADGGVLVLGVQTKRDALRNEDVSSKVSPFKVELFDLKQCRDRLAADVYPPVQDLDVRAYDRDNGRRLVAIVVPEQLEDRKPFIITRVITETGEHVHAFALPRRAGSHTAFDPVGLVHRDISDGRRSRQLAVPQAPNLDATPQATLGEAEDRVSGRIEGLEQQIEWSRIPAYFLASVPPSGSSRPQDFYALDGLRQSLSRPSTLRSAGFGLTYGVDVRVLDGAIVSVDPERTVVMIDPDGLALAGGAGTPDFLGWAQDQVRPRPKELRINPVVIVEHTLEFSRFVYRELVPRWGPKRWRLFAAVRRAQTGERPLALSSGYRPNFPFGFRKAEQDNLIDFVDMTGDAGTDAFRLLTIVYGVFGITPDGIPFVSDGRVDEKKILALG